MVNTRIWKCTLLPTMNHSTEIVTKQQSQEQLLSVNVAIIKEMLQQDELTTIKWIPALSQLVDVLIPTSPSWI